MARPSLRGLAVSHPFRSFLGQIFSISDALSLCGLRAASTACCASYDAELLLYIERLMRERDARRGGSSRPARERNDRRSRRVVTRLANRRTTTLVSATVTRPHTCEPVQELE